MKTVYKPQAMTKAERAIENAVLHITGKSFDELRNPTRKREIVEARQMAMYLYKKHTKFSTPVIGGKFGRDHATVLHAQKVMKQLASAYPAYMTKLMDAEAYINNWKKL
ncbi:MAG: hypothetical protein K9I74_14625 [Bacteroidales bacterium]|nr:hypothetical protein [Bacteroidales bacterium]